MPPGGPICCLLGACCPPSKQEEAWKEVLIMNGMEPTAAAQAARIMAPRIRKAHKAATAAQA